MKHKSSKIPNKRLYRIYHNMKQRCYNPNNPSYSYYGGKGITICQEWLDNFMNFYNWSIQNGYEDDLTIDRKESSKGYCPENCRWITLKENSRRGLNKKVENNIMKLRELTNLSQPKFCQKYGIPLSTLHNWEQGCRKCPDYVTELLEFVVKQDLKMDNITPEEFYQKMLECKKLDKERAHEEMDALLCETLKQFGYSKGIDVYESADRWYS